MVKSSLRTAVLASVAACINSWTPTSDASDVPMAIEEATFIRLDHGAYRDGVRFRNGREISIQQLSVGVGAIVTTVVETAAHTHQPVPAH